MEAVISKVLEQQHYDDASTDNRSVLAKFQLMLQRLGVDASAPPKLAVTAFCFVFLFSLFLKCVAGCRTCLVGWVQILLRSISPIATVRQLPP